jgi:flagellar biosynthesis protein FlhG
MMSLLATLPAGSSQADALLGRRTAGASRELGRDEADHAVPTLLCASGRGGSGTTLLSALLAVAAAGDGVRVLLIDADEHVGPLSMVLGATAHASWQDLRGGRFTPADIVTPISTTLTLVAGGAPRVTPGAALTAAERRACMRRIGSLSGSFDLVVVDCGARFDNVVSAVIPHSGERLLAVTAGADPIGLAATYALCKAVHTRHGALPIDVLVNRHEGSEASRCFDTIDAGARQFLGTALRLAGAVPADPTLDAALRSGMPFPDAAAGSPAAVAAHDVVMRLLAGTSSTRPGV